MNDMGLIKAVTKNIGAIAIAITAPLLYEAIVMDSGLDKAMLAITKPMGLTFMWIVLGRVYLDLNEDFDLEFSKRPNQFIKGNLLRISKYFFEATYYISALVFMFGLLSQFAIDTGSTRAWLQDVPVMVVIVGGMTINIISCHLGRLADLFISRKHALEKFVFLDSSGNRIYE